MDPNTEPNTGAREKGARGNTSESSSDSEEDSDNDVGTVQTESLLLQADEDVVREEGRGLCTSYELVARTGGVLITPRIPLWIEGKTVQALVDTGASVNLIRPDLVQGREQEPRPTTLNLPSRSMTMRARGAMDIAPKLGGVTVELRVLVVDDLREELILGQPFMLAQEVVIDWKNKTVTFGTQERKTVNWSDEGSTTTGFTLGGVYEQVEDTVPEERTQDTQEENTRFADVRSEEPIPATTTTTRHHIVSRDPRPARVPHYGYSEGEKRQINETSREMPAQGGTPVLLIEKRDDGQRFCVESNNDVAHEPPEGRAGTPEVEDPREEPQAREVAQERPQRQDKHSDKKSGDEAEGELRPPGPLSSKVVRGQRLDLAIRMDDVSLLPRERFSPDQQETTTPRQPRSLSPGEKGYHRWRSKPEETQPTGNPSLQ